ncbi:MAG: Asp-tRNA(Asn)/Glu-tRNA(Gln) amidotransferase subunit GatA [Chloroflexi bacterium]|nr:Asp-tRNA(Asn)/Glu-tRNA(Gln) amidotransferase subunit GatA [Chloroflexota bacterium]
MELYQLTVHAARELLQTGGITSLDLTRAILERIEKIDPRVHAYLTVIAERALDSARDADARWTEHRRDGSRAPALLGIPMAIKDEICTRGVRTTAGSKILHNFVPPYDATVMEKLNSAGAILIGKTNQDEFAMGSSTENSRYFTTRNPWDLERVPGGSSGGSAAAVAADETLFALGTDTGGSVRQPAGLTNTVGLRPTYGRVSRFGVIAFASSLDQVGPITKDVRDAAIILGAIAGHDPREATSVNVPVPDYVAAMRVGAMHASPLQNIRVGVPREYFIEGMQPGVARAVRDAIHVLESLGATTQEVSLPHTDYALPTYYLIAPAEASANLARYDGVKYGYRAPFDSAQGDTLRDSAQGDTLRDSAQGSNEMWDVMRATRGDGFGAEVKRRIMLGTYALSAGYYDAYYLKAQKVRTLIKQDFDRAFEQVDVIVGPTSPSTAFKIGEKVDDPLQMYLADVFTLAQALAGIPAISIPCGFADNATLSGVEGLPVGLQIMGRAFDEPRVLQVAYAYEHATDWHTRKPQL